MNKDIDIPQNIVGYFFNRVIRSKKFAFEMNDEDIILLPLIDNKKDYNNKVIIDDVDKLENALLNYINAINNFYKIYPNIEMNHSVEYYLDVLIMSYDYNSYNIIDYINKKSLFFGKDCFECDNIYFLLKIDNKEYYYQKEIDNHFKIKFISKEDNKNMELPCVSYFIDGDTCYIYSIKKGNNKPFDLQFNNSNYILSLGLFIKLLNTYNIDNIVVPNTVIGNYFKLKNINYNNSEIFKTFLELLKKFDIEMEEFTLFNSENDSNYIYLKFRSINKREIFKESISL